MGESERYAAMTVADKVCGPNLIFLDGDGVLNYTWAKVRTPDGYVGIVPSRVKILAEIVREHETEIILSSSWKEFWSRNNENEKQTVAGDYLDACLLEEVLVIQDKTPGFSWERGRGIYSYLQSHPRGDFIVLDDDDFRDFRKYGILPHWIRTSWELDGGPQNQHVRCAWKLFRLPRWTAPVAQKRKTGCFAGTSEEISEHRFRLGGIVPGRAFQLRVNGSRRRLQTQCGQKARLLDIVSLRSSHESPCAPGGCKSRGSARRSSDQRIASAFSMTLLPAWHAGQTQYFSPAAFAPASASACPSPKICFAASDS